MRAQACPHSLLHCRERELDADEEYAVDGGLDMSESRTKKGTQVHSPANQAGALPAWGTTGIVDQFFSQTLPARSSCCDAASTESVAVHGIKCRASDVCG